MDYGIIYIMIVDDKTDVRFKLAEACNEFTDPILRKMFVDAGMELKSGSACIKCKKEDLKGRYDLVEGIDMLLRFKDDTKGTLQQKTLYTDWNTATFEEMKTSGKPGAWYYCTAQYYFVIYTVESDAELREQLKNGNLKPTINEAILLNLAEVHKLSMNNKIMWENNINQYEGRRSSFRYTFFKDIPKSCIIAKYSIVPDVPNLPFE